MVKDQGRLRSSTKTDGQGPRLWSKEAKDPRLRSREAMVKADGQVPREAMVKYQGPKTKVKGGYGQG